jgi:hypothetical protein
VVRLEPGLPGGDVGQVEHPTCPIVGRHDATLRCRR